MRRLHLQRQDPGLPNWNPEWSTEEFDLRHLGEAMRLTRRLRLIDERLIRRMRQYSMNGIRPLPLQRSHFPHPNTAYAVSWENEQIREAPTDAISDWMKDMPREAELSGPVRSQHHEEATVYPAEHPIEYPDDMDLSVGPNIEPGDSASNIGDPRIQDRIMAPGQTAILQLERPPYPLNAELAKPVRWTLEAEARPQLDISDPKVLRSHMC